MTPAQLILLASAAALVLTTGFLLYFMTLMPGRSFAGDSPRLSESELEVRTAIIRHVQVLAGEIGERSMFRRGTLDRAAQYITDQLELQGYEVTTQEYVVSETTVRNIEAERIAAARPEEIVIVGAHYDSVMGCPGANDNGSGVAALLEIARLSAQGPRTARTLRFVAFANEEPPFFFTSKQGSVVYARRCRERRERVVAMYSLETIGCYFDQPGTQRYPFPLGLFYPRTGNFIGFVGNLSSRSLVRQSIASFRRNTPFPSEGAAAYGYIPGVYWSDQWAFWRQGYPGVMITDTAPFRYPFYHTVDDTPDKLDYDRTARVVVGLAKMIQDVANNHW